MLLLNNSCFKVLYCQNLVQLCALCSLRKEQCDSRAKAPSTRAAGRRIRPITRAYTELHQLIAHFCQLGNRHVDRHRPLLRLPIVGRLGIQTERKCGLGGVAEKRLEKRRTDVGAIAVTAN